MRDDLSIDSQDDDSNEPRLSRRERRRRRWEERHEVPSDDSPSGERDELREESDESDGDAEERSASSDRERSRERDRSTEREREIAARDDRPVSSRPSETKPAEPARPTFVIPPKAAARPATTSDAGKPLSSAGREKPKSEPPNASSGGTPKPNPQPKPNPSPKPNPQLGNGTPRPAPRSEPATARGRKGAHNRRGTWTSLRAPWLRRARDPWSRTRRRTQTVMRRTLRQSVTARWMSTGLGLLSPSNLAVLPELLGRVSKRLRERQPHWKQKTIDFYRSYHEFRPFDLRKPFAPLWFIGRRTIVPMAIGVWFLIVNLVSRVLEAMGETGKAIGRGLASFGAMLSTPTQWWKQLVAAADRALADGRGRDSDGFGAATTFGSFDENIGETKSRWWTVAAVTGVVGVILTFILQFGNQKDPAAAGEPVQTAQLFTEPELPVKPTPKPVPKPIRQPDPVEPIRPKQVEPLEPLEPLEPIVETKPEPLPERRKLEFPIDRNARKRRKEPPAEPLPVQEEPIELVKTQIPAERPARPETPPAASIEAPADKVPPPADPPPPPPKLEIALEPIEPEITIQGKPGELQPGEAPAAAVAADDDKWVLAAIRSSPRRERRDRETADTYDRRVHPVDRRKLEADLKRAPDDDNARTSADIQVKVQKRAPEASGPRDTVAYEVTVRNDGRDELPQVIVEDRIPDGYSVVSVSPLGLLEGTTLRWQLGRMAGGEEQTLKVELQPQGEGVLDTTSQVRAYAVVNFQTEVTGPKLKLDVIMPDRSHVGERVPVKFRVTNKGTAPATKVLLQEDLSPGLSHKHGRQLDLEIGTLAPGESRELQLTVDAATVGNAVLRSAVIASEGNRDDVPRDLSIAEAPPAPRREPPRREIEPQRRTWMPRICPPLLCVPSPICVP